MEHELKDSPISSLLVIPNFVPEILIVLMPRRNRNEFWYVVKRSMSGWKLDSSELIHTNCQSRLKNTKGTREKESKADLLVLSPTPAPS